LPFIPQWTAMRLNRLANAILKKEVMPDKQEKATHQKHRIAAEQLDV